MVIMYFARIRNSDWSWDQINEQKVQWFVEYLGNTFKPKVNSNFIDLEDSGKKLTDYSERDKEWDER